MTPRESRPDYGLDAPKVVRNLLAAGGAGYALPLGVALHLWPPVVGAGPVAGVTFRFPLAALGLSAGTACLAMGLWMIWTSRVGKVRGRERLLDRIAWTGHERVLDVGCGRGLLLVGAARRLTDGTAVGIDVWQAEDLSGNRPEATLENARREGVADRVEVRTADMRKMSFPDASFDVVVSSAAIHNLYAPDERAAAVREIARVLKKGGTALIDDIRHGSEYARVFAANGCSAVRRADSPLASFFLAFVTFGSLRPATLLVRKMA